MSSGDSKLALVAGGLAIAIQLGFHLIAATVGDAPMAVDYRSFYRPVAESLLDGDGLTTADGQLAVRYPPGYPLALTLPIGLARLIGVNPEPVVRLWVTGLAGVAAALVFLIARLYFPPRASLLAAGVWSVYPLGLWTYSLGNSEVLFIPLLLVVFLMYCRSLGCGQSCGRASAAAVAIGALCGALALVRPAAIGLALVLAALWWVERRGSVSRPSIGALLICVSYLVVVLPWVVYGSRQAGRLVPLSVGGAPSLADGLTFGVRDRDYRVGTWVPARAREVMQVVDDGYSPALSSTDVAALFLDGARSNPAGAIQLIGIKAARSWYGTDSQLGEGVVLLVQLLFLPAAALGVWRAARDADPVARSAGRAAGVIVAYLWLTAIAGLSIARYTVPALAVALTMLPAVFRAQASGSGRPDSLSSR